MEIKLCKDCKWSKSYASWYLQCFHPDVISKDPNVLSAPGVIGSDCKVQRSLKATGAPCGMRGYLFESK